MYLFFSKTLLYQHNILFKPSFKDILYSKFGKILDKSLMSELFSSLPSGLLMLKMIFGSFLDKLEIIDTKSLIETVSCVPMLTGPLL